jgi:hypothetical protein
MRWLAALGVAAFLSIAVVIAVQRGSFYDDEISNVRQVEGRDIGSIIHTANSTDVHPPGSYVLNALILRLLGSWESVKIAGGCLNALALAVFLFMAFSSLTRGQRLLLAGVLATASTTLLWSASIRWYSYFNPVFTVALGLLLFSTLSRTARSRTGGTCQLPQITDNNSGTSLVGLPYWFTNTGLGPCTITTQAAQTFSGQPGLTTLTVQSGGSVGLSAEPSGSGFTWHVLSYVQPSEVRYGSVAVPTTTVASLPACGPAQKGLLYSVSDAAAPAYNAPVTGGGTNTIPVFCNGTAWTAH